MRAIVPRHFSVHQNHLENLSSTSCSAPLLEFLIQWIWRSLRIYLPNKFPGTTDVVHQRSHFEKLYCSPRWCSGKESACQCRRLKRGKFNPWAGKIPWGRKWQPIPVFLPEKFHGQRSLASNCPWGYKSQTQRSTHTYTHTHSSPYWCLV